MLSSTADEDVLVRIGCYTGGSHAGPGIVTARVAVDGSRIEQVGVTRAEEPSYLAASGRRLYAVGETGDGTMTAFRFAGNALEPVNVAGSDGAEPCHLAVAGGFLAVVNYASGSVVVRRLRADGGIGEQTCLIQHTGRGPVGGRQDSPHPHMIAPDPRDNRILLVADLGTDTVCAYRLDQQTGELAVAGRTALPPGCGPRHLAFHPAAPFVYVLCELDNSLLTLAWDRAAGQLTPLGRVAAVAAVAGGAGGAGGTAYCSAIRVSPDGRYLYTACRGPDMVTVFGLVHPAAPERADVVPSGGASPRDIVLAAGGRLLLCANQESGTVTVLRVDPATGVPALTGATLTTPAPVCVLSAH